MVPSMQADEAAGRRLPRPQYPGDDTRPTSRKELLGWYSYGWAAEVFTVCAMGEQFHVAAYECCRQHLMDI